ncbi:MAG: hypothetical protein OEZ06_01270 [Myxococcales bacterium]|nr:hypothetical protein [Myxococcales bacterium]
MGTRSEVLPPLAACLAVALLCGGCGEDDKGSTPGLDSQAETGAATDATGNTGDTGDTGALAQAGSSGSSDPSILPAEIQPAGGDTAADPVNGAAGEAGGEHALALDECGLNTGFPGDEYCILPPPPGEGFQVHIGPDDYDNPDAAYILAPGEEDTSDFAAVSGNDTDIFFYYRQYRMRPGAHHMIASVDNGAGFGGGRRIGTANLSQDSPAGGIIAPENEGVGIPLDAKSDLNVSLHVINVTEQPILREVWINFWYRDPEKVTEPATQLFKTGSTTFAIQPGEDTTLGTFSCDISGEGRMLWFYGHRHANTVRFSAWRVRDGQRDLFYDGYHWEEPLLLEYTSLIENPVPDYDAGIEGGWSGILDLKDGDSLEWECHVINQTDSVLRFTNETFLGEMCIMDGEMVGVDCGGF